MTLISEQNKTLPTLYGDETKSCCCSMLFINTVLFLFLILFNLGGIWLTKHFHSVLVWSTKTEPKSVQIKKTNQPKPKYKLLIIKHLQSIFSSNSSFAFSDLLVVTSRISACLMPCLCKFSKYSYPSQLHC